MCTVDQLKTTALLDVNMCILNTLTESEHLNISSWKRKALGRKAGMTGSATVWLLWFCGLRVINQAGFSFPLWTMNALHQGRNRAVHLFFFCLRHLKKIDKKTQKNNNSHHLGGTTVSFCPIVPNHIAERGARVPSDMQTINISHSPTRQLLTIVAYSFLILFWNLSTTYVQLMNNTCVRVTASRVVSHTRKK